MERLTTRLKNGRTILIGGLVKAFNPKIGNFYEGKPINKLAEYEDAEENGLLIKLPCKVGSKVYRFAGINGSGRIIDSSFCISDRNEIGKTVFLTKEEAEAKLKKIKEESNVL